MAMGRFSRIARCVAVSSAAASLAACMDATDVELLRIDASGSVTGEVYLDLNRSGQPDGGDQPLAGVPVVLLPLAGGAAVAEEETDAEGLFVFNDVPVGSYELDVAPEVLGDSLVGVGPRGRIHIALEEPAEAVLGVSFPELTIEEVREAPPGRRVFTTGITLNPRQPFSRGQVFLKGGSAYLQTNGVGRDPEVVVGDSVRFLGRTSVQDGRPALADVTPIVLVRQAQVPLPLEISTGDAADADSGTLDAALVQIQDADVSEGEVVGEDYHFTVNDGSGEVEVVLRAFLGFAVQPEGGDLVQVATGMLAPHDDGSGTIRWRLIVRAASELVLAAP
jgi:hypothetical protein